MWKSSTLYMLCCLKPPHTLDTCVDRPPQATQQSYQSLRWPCSCEFPNTASGMQITRKPRQFSERRGTSNGMAEIFPSVNGSRFWSQASKQSDPDCFLVALPQVSFISLASCPNPLWPAAVSILPWGSAANPSLESQAGTCLQPSCAYLFLFT